MTLLDTDTVSLLFAGHPRVVERYRQATDDVATTLISRVEVLQGRFASLLKAVDGQQLQLAHQRWIETEKRLAKLLVVPVAAAAAAVFDRLRQDRKLKKIGRADLLIASIALANRARLITRNLRHFRQVPGLDVENWAD